MPKVLDDGTHQVYVYANDSNPHHLPHCHVYWDGHDCSSVVSLPDLSVIVGDPLPRAARKLLAANAMLLIAQWHALNPREELKMMTWTRAAMQLARSRYDPRRGILTVSFRNGDRFEVPVEMLLQSAAAARWDCLRIGETQDVLEIPIADGIAEIPWDRIRCVADPAYRQHLANQAAQSAHRVAGRLRQLRRETGLTQEAVGRAAGVARVTISRLENNQLQPTYETLVRVLAAMGKNVADLAPDQDAVPASGRAQRRPRSKAAIP